MSESHRLQQTPIDEKSRLPYLFVPDDRVLAYLAGKKNYLPNSNVPICDDNHVWHERQLVKNHLDGQGEALRKSRMQFVLRASHNNYHGYYGGPPLPETAPEMYGTLLLQLADYIPPIGLDMRRASPRKRFLDSDQIVRLQQSGEVRPESAGSVRGFVTSHLLSQQVEVSAVNRDLLLSGGDPAYNYEVMGAAFGVMIDQIGESLPQETQAVYRYGYEHRLIHPAAPPSCEMFVLDYMVGNSLADIMPYATALQDQVQSGQ